MRVAYFCSSFPIASETFLPREAQALSELHAQLDIYSLSGGNAEQWVHLGVKKVGIDSYLSALSQSPVWLFKKLGFFTEAADCLFLADQVPSQWSNFTQTLKGICMGVSLASRIQHNKIQLLHATDGGLSATAAWTVHRLTGIPLSIAMHTQNIFIGKGDWLLPQKIRDAAWIRTSTESTRQELIHRFPHIRSKSTAIPPGLLALPHQIPQRFKHPVIRCLSIGPLVERKGYSDLLDILAQMKKQGVAFEARIVGQGPLKRSLIDQSEKLAISPAVKFLGALPAVEILNQYLWSDIYLYTGHPTADGDRDDLPHAILEAMATGLPVFTTPLDGLLESVTAGFSGIVCPIGHSSIWVQSIQRVKQEPELAHKLQANAREWAQTHFDARKNAALILDNWKRIALMYPSRSVQKLATSNK
ncbi:MAG TPA: glycosyltransferase family 4 protein [Opitutales bacterium]|nr:glycosyltransferase family 4 protein [Opitutales bacterium]